MPQPLSSLRRDVSFSLAESGVYPLREREKLARMAMEGIATWATVESFMLRLYITLAGGNQSLAADMFIAMETNSAKQAALQTLIKRLSDRDRQLYDAIAKLLKSRSKARDKLAHWTWGISPQLPDALLLADPKDVVRFLPPPKIYEQIFVYKESDFLSIIRDNEELSYCCSFFQFIVAGHPADRGGELYQRLCAVPAIAEILRRQAAQG